MNEPRNNQSDSQLEILQELVDEGAYIDGDVLEIAEDTWAVHGVVGYDGEVPMAVFDTYEEAKHVLDQVAAAHTRAPASPRPEDSSPA